MEAKAIVAGTKIFSHQIKISYAVRAFTHSVRSLEKLRVTHIYGTIRNAPFSTAQIINYKSNPTEPLC
jgi:hypothetical protein